MSFPRFKYYPDTIGSSPSWQFFRCLSFTPTSSTSTSTWRLCLRCAIFHLRKFLGRSAFRPLELVHLFFLVFGQFPSYLSISFQSIQSVLVTSAFMMVVSFILIPNPVCSLWVAFSIMSIEVCSNTCSNFLVCFWWYFLAFDLLHHVSSVWYWEDGCMSSVEKSGGGHLVSRKSNQKEASTFWAQNCTTCQLRNKDPPLLAPDKFLRHFDTVTATPSN